MAWGKAAASGWVLLLAGCGLASNPQPPTLWLPNPVKDLTARRVGNDVQLHWTMPKETTDKVRLKGNQKAHLCWESSAAAGKPGFDSKACASAGDGEFPPNKPVEFTVRMPAELVTGTPHAVSYFVELQNHAGKTAGPSNAALVATSEAPPAIADFHLETRSDGVVLHWAPAAPEAGMVLRIHQSLVQPPAATKAGAEKAKTPKPEGPHSGESNGAPPPEELTLEVDLDKTDPGEALDRDATLDHVWRYRVERVLRVEADHHALEIEGTPSETVTIDAKDVFPPAVPRGLVAIADEQAHAIDLSWTPDTEADLAGYFVYRRDVTAGTSAERVSGASPVVPPSFTDANVKPGDRYAYSVSAVDRDGNESVRSNEVEEKLPQ